MTDNLTENWWTGWVECNVCGDRHVAVIPIGPNESEPQVRMECLRCHAMTCDPIEVEDDIYGYQ